ncbi:zinc finger protein 37 homolog [Anopheles moucheti]|uniref:zinc finger protein 37 homolog n=1 Tax=Anopheles moucheti TaxID=186751 RepID=UPI0022F13545|nr:zinc finger protein 37 homolog [Anopheles moucheti]
MANALRELSEICRFCLCQNERLLLPIAKTLDKLLTIEDIERFSGIQLSTTSYAICLECINKLKMSAEFRILCLSNDSRFQMLRSMLMECTESPKNEAIECLELLDDDIDMLKFECSEENDTECSYDGSFFTKTIDQENSYAEKHTARSQKSFNTACDEINSSKDYSANYIEPGVALVSDEEDIDPKDSIFTPLNPTYPLVDPLVPVRGKRKLHLCNICGIFVKHIPKHIINHDDDIAEACPHCPVKMKQKANLVAHIRTVHLKTIGKTCEICGKGFVHHKTYRYHMTSHQDEGEIFECKACSKTFSHSNALKDHFNRLHNIARKQK